MTQTTFYKNWSRQNGRLEAVRAPGLADDEMRRKWYNFFCMAGDTAAQAEKEEDIPVNFGMGGVVLKTLRNLSALRSAFLPWLSTSRRLLCEAKSLEWCLTPWKPAEMRGVVVSC